MHSAYIFDKMIKESSESYIIVISLTIRTRIMEFLPRSGKELVLEGFVYSQQKILKNNVISWKCTNRRNKQSCKARIKTLNGQEVGRFNDHIHLADPEKISVTRISGMKQRAQTTRECTRDIISTSVGGHTPEVLANLPNEEVIRRDIRRQRKRTTKIIAN